MTGAAELYRARLLANEELIAKIQPGDTLALGTWMGQPHGFMLSLTRFGANIAPLYVITAPASGAGELLFQPNIVCFSSFMGPYERAAQRLLHPRPLQRRLPVYPDQPAAGFPHRADCADGRARLPQPVVGLELDGRRSALVVSPPARAAHRRRGQPAHAPRLRPAAIRE